MNGKFAFGQFSMLSMGISYFFSFLYQFSIVCDGNFVFLQWGGDGWMDPCVLQDIGPLGPLSFSHSITLLEHSKQGIGYR